jgi:uncharacterized protein YkvS
MKTIKFSIVAQVSLDEDKLRMIASLGAEISPETDIESVIKDHVQDRGMLININVLEGDIYKDVKEYQHTLINHKAVEELEQEILDAKACINGNCED